MENYISKFKNSNIIKVLDVAKPKIEELTEKYIQSVLKEEEKHPSKFAIEMYQLGLIYDLIRSISKYIEDTDDLQYFELKRSKGIFVIEGSIVRLGLRYSIDTEIILAGGYNIQCLHYRYLVKTNLPKTAKENSLAARVKELIKSKNALQRLNEEEKYKRDIYTITVSEIQSKMTMTDQQIIEEKSWLVDMLERVWEELPADVQINFNNSKEEFERRRKNEVNQEITRHRSYYSQNRIDYLKKELDKNLKRLEVKRKKIEG